MLALFAFYFFLGSSAVLAPGAPAVSLRDEIKKLADAMNRRDLEALRSEITASRIYVELTDRPGAYLTSSQTAIVMQSFLESRTSISSTFDLITDDGERGSASGHLAARKDGQPVNYRLNFGFLKNDEGKWVLTKISIE